MREKQTRCIMGKSIIIIIIIIYIYLFLEIKTCLTRMHQISKTWQ